MASGVILTVTLINYVTLNNLSTSLCLSFTIYKMRIITVSNNSRILKKLKNMTQM